MIAKLARGALDLYAIQATGGDQAFGSLMTGQPAGGAYLAPLVIGMPYIPGGESHQSNCGDHEAKIHGIKVKHVSLLLNQAKSRYWKGVGMSAGMEVGCEVGIGLPSSIASNVSTAVSNCGSRPASKSSGVISTTTSGIRPMWSIRRSSGVSHLAIVTRAAP